MIQGNGPPLSYQVIVSDLQKNEIKQLHLRAIALGKGHEFLNALRIIGERLRKDPTTFGDPLYPLPTLKLFVFQAAVPPLVAHYGVHQEMPLVILQGVKSLLS
jgi:hypothetical protein